MKPRPDISGPRKAHRQRTPPTPHTGQPARLLTAFKGGSAAPSLLRMRRGQVKDTSGPRQAFGFETHTALGTPRKRITPQSLLDPATRKAQERWLADVKRDPERAKDIRRSQRLIKGGPDKASQMGLNARQEELARNQQQVRAASQQARKAERTDKMFRGINRPDIEQRARLGIAKTQLHANADIQRLMALGRDTSQPLSTRRAAYTKLRSVYDVPISQEQLQAQRKAILAMRGQDPEGTTHGTTNLGFVHLPTGAISSQLAKEITGKGFLNALGTDAAKGWEMAAMATGVGNNPVGRVAVNAAKDAVNLPAQMIPSLYLTGRALAKAAPRWSALPFTGIHGSGDSSELHALWQSYKDTGVLPALFTGHFGEALNHAAAHPVYSALELRGFKAGVGRIAGAGMRGFGRRPGLVAHAVEGDARAAVGAERNAARGSGRDVSAYLKEMMGSDHASGPEGRISASDRQGLHQNVRDLREKLYSLADTRRPDLRDYGQRATQGRSYSKDVTGKAFQRAYERRDVKKGLDPHQVRTGTWAHLTGRHVKQHRDAAVNTRVATFESMRREGRAAGLHEVATVLDTNKPLGKDAPAYVELAPWIVKRVVRSQKTWREDLQKEIDRLAEVRDATDKQGRTGFDRNTGKNRWGKADYKQNERLVALHDANMKALEAMKGMTDAEASKAFEVARNFDEWSRRTRVQLIDRGLLTPAEADARFSPYAMAHMGAKWTKHDGQEFFSVDGKTPLTAEAIQKHMAENAPEDFVGPPPEPAVNSNENLAAGIPHELRIPPGEVTSPIFAALTTDFRGGAVWHGAESDRPVVVTGHAGTHGGRDYMHVEGSSTAVPLDELKPATATPNENPQTAADHGRGGFWDQSEGQVAKLEPGQAIPINERFSIRRVDSGGTPSLPVPKIPAGGLDFKQAVLMRGYEVLNRDTKDWRDEEKGWAHQAEVAAKTGNEKLATFAQQQLEEHRATGDQPWAPHPDEERDANVLAERSKQALKAGKTRSERAAYEREQKARVAAAETIKPADARVGDQIRRYSTWDTIETIKDGVAYVRRVRGPGSSVIDEVPLTTETRGMKPETQQKLKQLRTEETRIARLLDAADKRQAESWDKPRGVQERVARTVDKHNKALDRVQAQIKELEAAGEGAAEADKQAAIPTSEAADLLIRRLPDKAPEKPRQPKYEVVDHQNGDSVVARATRPDTATRKALKAVKDDGQPEPPPVAPDPRPPSTRPTEPTFQMMSEEMRRYVDPGFISEATKYGKSAFYRPWYRGGMGRGGNGARESIVQGRRTGEAFRMGYAPTDAEMMAQEMVRTRGAIDAADAFDEFFKEFGIRHPSGRYWQNVKQAKAWVATQAGEFAQNQVGDDLVPVRIADIQAARFKLQQMKAHGAPHQTASPEGLSGLEDPNYRYRSGYWSDRLQKMVTMPNDPKYDSGAVLLVPANVVKTVGEHLDSASTSAERTIQAASSAFKGTVLPFSPRWFMGNIVDIYGLRAFASYGLVNPYEYVLGRKLARDLAEKDPAAGRKLRAMGLGGTHISSQDNQRIHRTSEDLAGTTKTLGAKTEAFFKQPSARRFLDAFHWLQRSMFAMNKHIEVQPQYAALGRHARRMIQDQEGSYAKSVKLSRGAYEDVLNGLSNTRRQEAFAHEVETMFGRWNGLSPVEKSVLLSGGFVPFWAWMRNSAKFVYVTLPKDHPIKMGLAAVAADMSDQERKAMGLDWFSDNRQPPWRQGILPVGSGVRVQNFTSFGPYADFPSFLSNQVLPWASGFLDTMGGANWKNQPLKNPDGSDLDPIQKSALALYLSAESMVPLLHMARQGVEGGGSPYDTSNIFHPHTKPDSPTGLVPFIRAWADPFRQIKNSQQAGGSSAGANWSGASSGGGWSTSGGGSWGGGGGSGGGW